MIREVCSCSAEIETDEEDALDIVISWRKKHRHEFAPLQNPAFYEVSSNHDIAPGFQAPSPFEDD